MEIFQTIWTALTTPNETLAAILFFPFYFVDIFVNMLLFTTILNIKTTKKRKFLYVIFLGVIAYILRNFIPDPYGGALNLIISLFFIKFVLKTSWFKSFVAEFIGLFLVSILELFMFRLYFTGFQISYELIMNIPFHRIVSTLSIYLCIYLLYRVIRYCKFHINLENMTRKNRILFITNAIFGLISITTQFCILALDRKSVV